MVLIGGIDVMCNNLRDISFLNLENKRWSEGILYNY